MKKFMLALTTFAVLSAPAASAALKTYRLTGAELKEIIGSTSITIGSDGSYVKTFNRQGIDWTFTFASSGVDHSGDQVSMSLNQSDALSFENANFIKNLTVAIALPDAEQITAINFSGVVYYHSDTKCYYTITGGNKTKVGEVNLDPDDKYNFSPVSFTNLSNYVGKVSIEAYLDGHLSADAAVFNYVEFVTNVDVPDVVVVPTANPVAEVALSCGSSVWLTCEDADAEIFYRWNASGDWETYNAQSGVICAEAGTHTLEFYSCAPGKDNSEIVSETIKVTAPSGLEYAKSLYNEVSVEGVVVGHSDNYTLIGSNAAQADDDCLAVDNTAYPALRQATTGTEVSLSGRPTDRYGRPALGSISALSLNGAAQAPTAIVTVNTPSYPAQAYNLQGRKAVRTSRPQIIVTADGKKQIQR